MRLIAFITEAPAVNTILRHLCEPTSPPRSGPRTRPPFWDQAPEPVPDWADSPAPVPELVFDQPLELVAQRTVPRSACRASPHRLDAQACLPLATPALAHPPGHPPSKPRGLPRGTSATPSSAPAGQPRNCLESSAQAWYG